MCVYADELKITKHISIMETFENTLKELLTLMSQYEGTPAKFSVDYRKQEIKIHSATSGFLKRLYAHEKQNCSLHEGVISVNFFKK